MGEKRSEDRCAKLQVQRVAALRDARASELEHVRAIGCLRYKCYIRSVVCY